MFEPSESSSAWVSYEDPDNGVYYYNTVTGETSWALPLETYPADSSQDTWSSTMYQWEETPSSGPSWTYNTENEAAEAREPEMSTPTSDPTAAPHTEERSMQSPAVDSSQLTSGASLESTRRAWSEYTRRLPPPMGHGAQDSMNDTVWPATDTLVQSMVKNYETLRGKRLEGAQEVQERDPEEELEVPVLEVDTPLDPFSIKPWIEVQDPATNTPYYFNTQTGDSQWERPPRIWEVKLQALGRVTPRKVSVKERKRKKRPLRVGRPEYDEWKYRESEEEREERQRLEGIKQQERQREAYRRVEWPTSREQVEDVLADMCAKVEVGVKRTLTGIEHRERVKKRATWHPSTSGYQMKQLPLGGQSDLAGGKWEPRILVSDTELEPVYVSASNYVLPMVPRRPISTIVKSRRRSSELIRAILRDQAWAPKLRHLRRPSFLPPLPLTTFRMPSLASKILNTAAPRLSSQVKATAEMVATIRFTKADRQRMTKRRESQPKKVSIKESAALEDPPQCWPVEEGVMVTLYLACKAPPFVVKIEPIATSNMASRVRASLAMSSNAVRTLPTLGARLAYKSPVAIKARVEAADQATQEEEQHVAPANRDQWLKSLMRDIVDALETTENVVAIEEVQPVLDPKELPVVASSRQSSVSMITAGLAQLAKTSTGALAESDLDTGVGRDRTPSAPNAPPSDVPLDAAGDKREHHKNIGVAGLTTTEDKTPGPTISGLLPVGASTAEVALCSDSQNKTSLTIPLPLKPGSQAGIGGITQQLSGIGWRSLEDMVNTCRQKLAGGHVGSSKELLLLGAQGTSGGQSDRPRSRAYTPAPPPMDVQIEVQPQRGQASTDNGHGKEKPRAASLEVLQKPAVLDPTRPFKVKVLLMPEREVTEQRRMSFALQAYTKMSSFRVRSTGLDSVQDHRSIREKMKAGLKPRTATELAGELIRQLTRQDSPLRQGDVTHTAYRVLWKQMGGRRVFHTWEAFWCYVISPVFYGYNTHAKLMYGASKSRQVVESEKATSNKKAAFHQHDLLEQLQAAEDQFTAMQKRGCVNGHMTKPTHLAHVLYERTLRKVQATDRKKEREELGVETGVEVTHVELSTSNEAEEVTPELLARWEAEVRTQKLRKRRQTTSTTSERAQQRSEKRSTMRTYNKLRMWLYNELMTEFQYKEIFKNKLALTLRKDGLKIQTTELKDHIDKVYQQQPSTHLLDQDDQDRLSELFKVLDKDDCGFVKRMDVVRKLNGVIDDDQEPEQDLDEDTRLALMRVKGIEALVNKSNYTQAFFEHDFEREGCVTRTELLNFINAATHMVEYLTTVEQELLEHIQQKQLKWRENRLKRGGGAGVFRIKRGVADEDDDDEAGVRSPKAAKKVMSPKAAQAAKEQRRKAVKDALAREQELRVKRERFFAHHHTYIESAEEPGKTYCCLCRRRAASQNMLEAQEQETKLRTGWEHHVETVTTERCQSIADRVDRAFGPAEPDQQVYGALMSLTSHVEHKVMVQTEVAAVVFPLVDMVIKKHVARSNPRIMLHYKGSKVFVISDGAAEPRAAQSQVQVLNDIVGGDPQQRLKKLLKQKNKIPCSRNFTADMTAFTEELIEREKRRKIGRMEDLLELEEAERRLMFKEEMRQRTITERSLQRIERPLLLHQEYTHRLLSLILDCVPMVHPSVKRLRWERTINNDTNNLTYLVSDPPYEKKYILRLLTTTDPTSQAHIIKESRELMKLSDHTGLVSVKDMYHHRQLCFSVDGHTIVIHFCVIILLEYCAEGLMVDYLKTREVEQATMARYVVQLVTGLRSMHEGGLLHRNIRMDSFFIASSTHAKLGQYKFLKVTDDPKISTSDLYGGTETLAPELIKDGRERRAPTDKADIYALGYCLYRLLTGGRHPPFWRLREVANELPVKYSDHFSDIIQRCLRPSPEDRPTAAEILELLTARRPQTVVLRPAKLMTEDEEQKEATAGSGADGEDD